MIFDGHSDILADVEIKRLLGEKQIIKNYHIDRLRKGGIEGGCFVIFIEQTNEIEPIKSLEQFLKHTKDEMLECEDAVIVRNMGDIESAKKAGKFYILLGTEGLKEIGEDLEQINMLHDFGVRHAMLTWNEQNALATGVQGDSTRGVTECGKKAIKLIQDKKMILDVSHLNERSFWDVMNLTNGPILASHSNAKALADVTRNLTDQQLLAIRDTKGLVGLNAYNQHVANEVANQNIDSFVKQAVYIADKIGVEHLGFGFDFFEFLPPDPSSINNNEEITFTFGLEDCSKVPNVIVKMKEVGFTDKELEMVSRGNWFNLIRRVLG